MSIAVDQSNADDGWSNMERKIMPFDMANFEQGVTDLTKLTTKQLLFDYISRNMLEQNEPSINLYDECSYRGPNGLKCAVGFIIDDTLYREDIEGGVVYDPKIPDHVSPALEIVESSLGRKLSDEELGLLHDLQQIHDEHYHESWHKELKLLSQEHGLQFNTQ